jgi:hypothetical protein
LLFTLVVAAPEAAAASDILGAGATFPYPLYAKWAEAYKRKTGISMNYQSIGSGGGIQQIKAGTVDFGASDMPLKPQDLADAGLTQFPMIMGGVVPVIHPRSAGDPHLRSVEAVTGYHIHARDGEIGHVEDFLVEDEDWSVHFLVVKTRNWWPGREVLISPRSTGKIDWAGSLVNLAVDRQKVKDSPAYDPSMTVDRAYEKHYRSYYGDDLGTN